MLENANSKSITVCVKGIKWVVGMSMSYLEIVIVIELWRGGKKWVGFYVRPGVKLREKN